MTARIHLRAGHVQPVWMGHPWVFAQAVAGMDGSPTAGDAVEVLDPRGNLLGRGYWSPSSAIPVRLLTRTRDEALDGSFLRRRIEEAAAWRRAVLGLPSEETTGYRLVHAEGDGLPGLVVDVLGATAAVQFLTVGMKRREAELLDAVEAVTGARTVVEVASRRHQGLEGFEAREGVVRGEAVEGMRFRERGIAWEVGVPGSERAGQKTGFYFDQRENRQRVEGLARGRRVLDLYAYVGGFALAAARGGAREVVAVESSAPALEVLERAAREAGVQERVRALRGDARKVLAELEAAGERFDLVVLDPPKLAQRGREVGEALGHYRKLNAAAARRVERGGLLVTCSCSGLVGEGEFLRAVAAGVREANRDLVVLAVTGAGGDHPVPVAFPEGRYLKCVLGRLR